MSIVTDHLKQALDLLNTVLNDAQFEQSVIQATNEMVKSLKTGNTIFSCGNGGSMCDAMHFAEELSGRYRLDRTPFPAISISDPSHISCVGNDYGFDHVFERFIMAMGKPGDVLLAISTSGNSPNVCFAAEMAKKKGMVVIGLTGKDGGKLGPLCSTEIRVPWFEFADRIQEIHIKVIHSLIDGIEFGMKNS
jgi:D-sedoheptulose 7-phosphate isomerase